MSSPFGERAVAEALRYRNALIKVLSPNDVGATRSHQAGFLLPASAWQMYTPFPPESGRLDKHEASVTWQDGRVTHSVITWYSSKKEYRLTGEMSGEFPWRTDEETGSLFVLIRKSKHEYLAFVLDQDDDIQDLQSSLRIELPAGRAGRTWAAYRGGREEVAETADQCVARKFRRFAESLTIFPSGDDFSQKTITTLRECLTGFGRLSSDTRLIRCMDAEYQLFRLAERVICGPQVSQLFRDIDEFLNVANTMLNRRKSRAGRSLENHVEQVLRDSRIPFEMRPGIEGEPDIVIPGRAEYDDSTFPAEKLFVVGVKMTCKDRWRQVIAEAPRVRRKHLLTLQKTISAKQLQKISEANVSLVVPQPLQNDYPASHRGQLLNVESFIRTVKSALGTR